MLRPVFENGTSRLDLALSTPELTASDLKWGRAPTNSDIVSRTITSVIFRHIFSLVKEQRDLIDAIQRLLGYLRVVNRRLILPIVFEF